MNKLRNRLLIALILTAAMLPAAGGTFAWADSGRDADSRASSALARPTVRPLSGEPDSGGINTPLPKPSSVWVDPVLNPWLVQLWIKWTVAEKETGRSFHRGQ